METEDESDQLPESGADSYTDEDTGPGGTDSRDEATENPGGADEGDSGPDEATGNPPNAG
jgi:hypothetical protein